MLQLHGDGSLVKKLSRKEEETRRCKMLHILLKNHPDQAAVQFIVEGLQHGFSLGCKKAKKTAIRKNLKSAIKNEKLVTQALVKALKSKQIAGPLKNPR